MSVDARPQPVTPRPAATVLLVRSGDGGRLEVLMMQRPLTMRFMPGHWAFPGGVVDPADATPGAVGRVLGGEAYAATPERLGFVVAAVRELFEETGILLARPQDGRPLPDDLDRWRERLRQGASAFPELLAAHDLQIAGSELHYLQRRLTRASMPIRFDARFFVAPQPPGQVTRPFAAEVADVAWLEPNYALTAGRDGRLTMARPTLNSLTKLCAFATVAEVLHKLPVAPRLAEDAFWLEDPEMLPG